MSKQVCLRCDWTGDDDQAACPRCGAPLFRSDGSGTAAEDAPPAAEPSGPFVAPAPTGRRWVAAALGLAIAAVVSIGWLMAYESWRGRAPDLHDDDDDGARL